MKAASLAHHADVHSLGQAYIVAKKGGMTAREMIALLDANPAYRAMRARKDHELAQLAERRRLEQQPLLNDLAGIGIVVDEVGCLFSASFSDERFYPILLDHLQRPYSPWFLEWIGRAFGTSPARSAVWDVLIDLIKRHALESSAADGVMSAVSRIAQLPDLPTLIDLISDRSLGSRRVYLVSNLMRSKKPEARAALLRLQDDPELIKEIASRLRKRRV